MHNSGACGVFHANANITAINVGNEMYVMYWEGRGGECSIDKDGDGAIKVAEIAQNTIMQGRDYDTAIYKGDIVCFKMGTSGEQVFPLRTFEEVQQDDDKFKGILKCGGKIQITITSNPPLAKNFSSRDYIIGFDDKQNVIFREIPDSDK